MNTSTAPSISDVRGSWESTLEEANRLSANFNDDAIALYEKVFSGLLRIPPRLRKANNGRLDALLMRAGLGLHAYLNFRDRYTESLTTLRTLLDVVEGEDDLQLLQSQIVDVLILSNQYDEALATVAAIAEDDPDDLHNWGRVALTYTRVLRPEQAWNSVERMFAILHDEHGDEPENIDPKELSQTDRQQLTYAYGITALVGIENGDFERAMDAAHRTLDFEGLYAHNLPVFYSRLIARQQYDLALDLITADAQAPVRSRYWRGLVLKLRGQDNDAQHTWQQSLDAVQPKGEDRHAMPENTSPTEYILTRFQLGDPEGIGLEIVLRSLRERQNLGWVQFMLAGLGWALRGDRKTAKTDLDIAVARYKSSADGTVLPLQYWWTVATIFDAEKQAWLRPYFQTELPGHTTTPDVDSSA